VLIKSKRALIVVNSKYGAYVTVYTGLYENSWGNLKKHIFSKHQRKNNVLEILRIEY
jgi:hypothetical protein